MFTPELKLYPHISDPLADAVMNLLVLLSKTLTK
jgi:hypothetical protein